MCTQVMIDDYVLPSEPVVDFKTRFSGLVADDLDPYASRHHLVRNLKHKYYSMEVSQFTV